MYLDILLTSARDGFVQVSAFVAATVLLFGYAQYRTDGALLERLDENERYQPLVGALLGLTPGCGGAIVMMPLYVRGTVSFGTVVATLAATAGDSAFVVLALAPKAALTAYGLAFAAAVVSGYAVDRFGLGVDRVDRVVARLGVGASAPGDPTADGGRTATVREHCAVGYGPRDSPLAPVTHAVHAAWWVVAAAALVLGLTYLARGAPEVPFAYGLSFEGLFTVVGLTGTTLSLYLYGIGRRHLRDGLDTAYGALSNAAAETSFVTVWVIAAYLIYDYGVVLTGFDVQAVAAAAGLLAPVAGAAVGLIPGCGPQIVLAAAYVEGAVPFTTLTANAISQDGDALFPLVAVDPRAAVVATVYTTVPAVLVGLGIHLLFGPMFGFGVLG